MRAIPENIDRHQSIARACEGIVRNKQLLYGLLPGLIIIAF